MYLEEERRGHSTERRGIVHVNTEVEIGLKLPQTKEWQKPQQLEEEKMNLPLDPLERAWPAVWT